MAYTHPTNPVLAEAFGAFEVTVGAAVSAGDLLWYDATNDYFLPADEDATRPAFAVALQAGAASTRIHAALAAVVKPAPSMGVGVTEVTLAASTDVGSALYLSATAGQPALTAGTTVRQQVGWVLSTTSILLAPGLFGAGGTAYLDALDVVTTLRKAGTAITPTAAELNVLAAVVAGTSSASKAAVLGANKNLDILALPVSGLKVGAGAGTAVDRTAAELNALVQGIAAGYKLARGQATTVAASDTIASGLVTVVAVVATLDDDPVAGCQSVTASIGNQAGAPAAGSFYLKTWKATATADTALIAATTFSKKVNWVAIGT
ncbi:MAG: hypothetical protein HY331_15845 [Chloroflexi bacterium]|nr:hypothetical protein [Chloroflexota bacterium]